MKSDRYGKRVVTKFLTVLGEHEVFFRVIPKFCSYAKLLKALKKFDPTMSTYSIRRGSTTFLSDMGCAYPLIGLLTAHTPQNDPNLAVRRYVDNSPLQPESKEQLRMSLMLAQSLLPNWTPPGQKLTPFTSNWKLLSPQ